MSLGQQRRPFPRDKQSGGIFFRLLFLIFLAVFCFFLYLVRHPLLRFAGNFWVVDQSADSADAIVILDDDDYQADRATRAAELYKDGRAPRVIASGRFLRPYASIADFEARDLADRGVPMNAIVRLTHRATNMREEAFAISQLLSSSGWKRVLLVTSNYHTRRSRYICERAFPEGTFLHVVAAPDSEYDPNRWWQNRVGAKIFLHESAGMLVAMWEMRHNDVRTTGTGLFGNLLTPVSKLLPQGSLNVYTAIAAVL